MCVNKNCTVMTRVLSQLQSLAEDLQLAGVEGQRDGKLFPQMREEQMIRISRHVHVCVAPPMIVGALSMAVVLWQLLEYYYCYHLACIRVYPTVCWNVDRG